MPGVNTLIRPSVPYSMHSIPAHHPVSVVTSTSSKPSSLSLPTPLRPKDQVNNMVIFYIHYSNINWLTQFCICRKGVSGIVCILKLHGKYIRSKSKKEVIRNTCQTRQTNYHQLNPPHRNQIKTPHHDPVTTNNQVPRAIIRWNLPQILWKIRSILWMVNQVRYDLHQLQHFHQATRHVMAHH